MSEGLWEFAVRTYGRPGVSDACLALQNDHGADVNMLLYCCWIGGRFGKLPMSQFLRATEFSADWGSNVVLPLRSTRTWMKSIGCSDDAVSMDSCMNLREKIKTVELDSEKLQLQALESLIGTESQESEGQKNRVQHVASNLKLYAEHNGLAFSDEVQRLCAIIVIAALPSSEVEVVTAALRR